MIHLVRLQEVRNERNYHDNRFSKELEQIDKKRLLVGPNGYKDVNLMHIFNYIGLDNLAGRNCLEIGCGSGYITTLVAKKTSVVAGDISIQALRFVLWRAIANRVHANVKPIVLAGERLPFSDSKFDIVYGVGVLHHLNLKQASREIRRVLKPDGKLAFVEPLGHNLLLNLVRNLFSNHSPDEIKLTYRDILQFCQAFSHSEYHEYMLFSTLRLVIKWNKVIGSLEHLDSSLLVHWPFLRRYCRCVAILATR